MIPALLEASPQAAAILMVVAAILTLIKGWPALKKVQSESDASLRDTLLQRIATLETTVTRLESELRSERDRHAAEMALILNRLNNETQSLDALLLLIEAAPEKVPDNIGRIKEMRRERSIQNG